MIRSLTLVNFMAHARTAFALDAGLNVLCGPNNTGKSAVVEALRCLSTNPSPRHVIRHGAREARVEAELDNSWKVAWIRRKTYAIYEVTPPGEEPRVYAKLRKGHVPEEAAELLKLAPVRLDEDKEKDVDIHLGDQRHPIFLLDEPGSVLADFLAASTESAHLMAMQDLLRDKVRRAKTAEKNLTAELVRTEHSLDRLAKLPDVSLALETLRRESAALKEKTEELPRLEALSGHLQNTAQKVHNLARRAGRLGALAPPPRLSQASTLAAAIASMDQTRAKTAKAQATLERLTGLVRPPVIGDAASALGVIHGLERARSLKGRAKTRLAALQKLAAPPQCADPAPLARLVADMETLRARIAKGRIYLADRNDAVASLEAAITARLADVGECPLCGAGLDPGRFLKKAGGRGDS